MCNRARLHSEPETIYQRYSAEWAEPRPMDNRFDPRELRPKGRAYVVRQDARGRGVDVMTWDVLGGGASWPMTNVRNLALPQWRRLAERPEQRCLVPLTKFCEWTPDTHDVGGGKPIKGEMWFEVTDQPLFAVAGFWKPLKDGARGFAMVTCDTNELVAPIHPKAMITILAPEDHERWLTGGYEDVVALQRPYPPDRKVHALTDVIGRPYALLLTLGNVADVKAAPELLARMARARYVLADKPVLSLSKGATTPTRCAAPCGRQARSPASPAGPTASASFTTTASATRAGASSRTPSAASWISSRRHPPRQARRQLPVMCRPRNRSRLLVVNKSEA